MKIDLLSTVKKGKIMPKLKPRLLKPDEAANYLNISLATLVKPENRKKIPPVSITTGERRDFLRYDLRDLDKFIQDLPRG